MSKKAQAKANAVSLNPLATARQEGDTSARPRQRAAGAARHWPLADRLADVASVLAILMLGAYGIFSLPYAFPPQNEAPYSYSFAVGFNNRVATLAVLAVIGLLCLRSLFWRQVPAERVESLFYESGQPRLPGMSKSLLFLFMAVYLAITVLLYWCIPHLDEYGESLYALPRLELAIRYHLQPYRDVALPYGPALFYLPILFLKVGSWLGATHDAAYAVFYSCELLLGLWLLFYVVDNLRLKLTYRVVAFSALALGMLTTALAFAIQGTLIRFAGPYAALLIMHKVAGRIGPLRNPRAILQLCGTCLACTMVLLAISPEMGIAYMIAQSLYGLHKVIFSDRAWLYAILATVATLPLATFLFPNYLLIFTQFAKGGGDFPVYPAAHIVLFLLSLFWVLPILVRSGVNLHPSVNTPFVLAWACLVVTLLPAALGRCDNGHIFPNGVGLFLITFAVLGKFRPRLFAPYAVLFLLVYAVVMQVSSVLSYADYLQPVRMALAGRRVVADVQKSPAPPSPLAEKLGLSGYRMVATPMGVDRDTQCYLMDSKRFLPLYHMNPTTINMLSEMDSLVADLRKADAILAPEWILPLKNMSDEDIRRGREGQIEQKNQVDSQFLGMLLLYPVDFKAKYMAFDPWLLVGKHIASNYELARRGNGWVLMVPKPE